jgi:hypothetical protein
MTLCFVFLVAFAFGFGFWVGAINPRGPIAAIVIGTIGGAFIGFPMHSAHALFFSMLVAGSLGSLACWRLPPSYAVKFWLKKNNGLKIIIPGKHSDR